MPLPLLDPSPSSGGGPEYPATAGSLPTRERLRDPREDRFGLVDDLPPGDADDVEAECGELGVAPAVALEGLTRGVEGEAVDLDDEPLSRPEEVDLVAADAGVRQRMRKTRFADEGEQAALGLRAGEGDRLAALDQVAKDRGAAAARMAGEQVEEIVAAREPLRVGLGEE